VVPRRENKVPESISIAVRNDAGKIVMECVIETKASAILDYGLVQLSSHPPLPAKHTRASQKTETSRLSPVLKVKDFLRAARRLEQAKVVCVARRI